jgi:hypothetical protein
VFALIIIGVTVSAASIVYFVTKPAEITIEPHGNATDYEIKLYENEACTVELAKFNFPVAKGGDKAQVIFYIKNLSNGNVTVDATFEGNVPEGATGFAFMGEHYSTILSLCNPFFVIVTSNHLSSCQNKVPLLGQQQKGLLP